MLLHSSHTREWQVEADSAARFGGEPAEHIEELCGET